MAYAGLADGTFAPSPGLAPSSGGARPGADGEPVRPELADFARLGRRALRKVVHAARRHGAHADQGPPGASRPAGPGPPVVAETWPAYDHVNVQAGLDAWLAERGGRTSWSG